MAFYSYFHLKMPNFAAYYKLPVVSRSILTMCKIFFFVLFTFSAIFTVCGDVRGELLTKMYAFIPSFLCWTVL
jgi:hypothetical protein